MNEKLKMNESLDVLLQKLEDIKTPEDIKLMSRSDGNDEYDGLKDIHKDLSHIYSALISIDVSLHISNIVELYREGMITKSYFHKELTGSGIMLNDNIKIKGYGG